MTPDENDLPDEEIRRMWQEATPAGPARRLTTRTVTRKCEHMSASGPGLKLTCAVCGSVRLAS